MRLPPMTTRQWMAVVAVVGLLLGGSIEIQRLRRRQSDFSDLARWHSGFLFDWNARWRTDASEATARKIAYHVSLARKYEHAALHPWLPVEPDPPAPE
jgi:hypothetical protein